MDLSALESNEFCDLSQIKTKFHFKYSVQKCFFLLSFLQNLNTLRQNGSISLDSKHSRCHASLKARKHDGSNPLQCALKGNIFDSNLEIYKLKFCYTMQ